jgi:uncharacterized phage protein gp47/JayE
MTLSFQQLITPSTETESTTALVSLLDALGFTASSWQSGGLPLALVQTVARVHSALTQTRVTLALSRFSDTATDDWLELLSDDAFDNRKNKAVATQLLVQLSDPQGVGPFTFVPSQLVVSDELGHTYRNITGGMLAPNGTATLTFKAEIAGAASQPSSLVLATPIAGIVTTQLGDPFVVGTDDEPDPRLRTRNRTKWSTLAYAAPVDAYKAQALAASPNVTRVFVDDLNPRGPGTIDLHIAGAAGDHVLPSSVAADVYNYIEGITDGIVRRPVKVDLQVFVALASNVPITATITRDKQHTDDAIITATLIALDTLIAQAEIGGTVQLANIYTAIMGVAGVKNVTITVPTTDVRIAAQRVAVLQANLTVQTA